MSAGDSFGFTFQNLVSAVMSLVPGLGIVFGTAPGTSVNANPLNAKEYLLTVLAAGTVSIVQAATVSGSASLTGLTATQASAIQPGMQAIGTGIPAGATVIGINSSLGIATISANATATGTTGVTFTPVIRIDSIRASAL